MHDPNRPSLAKWPFFAGDALLLGAAYFVYARSELPMGAGQLAVAVFCVAAGALLSITPFLLEYRGLVRVWEAAALTSVVEQVRNLEALAVEIRHATAQWQNVQDGADKTVAAAQGIAERMAAEVKSFSEFMQRVNDTEKANLRLEVEKLRRGEGDWLQILVRMLDHVYALHQAGLRSRQPTLIEQLTHFQNACREAARRVGLTPFSAEPDEPFDPKRHQAVEGNGQPPDAARVGETVATGYTFQGRFLRAALVRLRDPEPGQTAAPDPAADAAPADDATPAAADQQNSPPMSNNSHQGSPAE